MIGNRELIQIVSNKQFGQRLDQVLVEMFSSFSRSYIKKLILDERVLINGKICCKPNKKVINGDLITIYHSFKNEISFKALNIPLNIVYEDDYLMIINKPKDLIVHPTINNHNYTMLNALLYHYPSINNIPRAGIIHRLDKDTTGLIIVAKTISAHNRLVLSLQKREITREYEAIVVGHVKTGGVIKQPIGRHPVKRTCMSVHSAGKPAVTYYQIIEHFRMHTYIRLRLETGRTHQIRVHMSYIMHPLVGDQIYNSYQHAPKGVSNEFIALLSKFNRQALHATMLRFIHPIFGNQIEQHAPIPQDMTNLITAMRTDLNTKIT